MQDYLVNFVNILFTILNMAIFARVLMSWFPIPPTNRVAQVLIEITDPVLMPLKRIIPPIGMFDISPIVAIFLLQGIHRLLLASLGSS